MQSSSGKTLELKEFRLRYPNSPSWTLKNLDLSINPGESLALVGESGCGKSTLAKAILQMLPRESISKGNLFLSGKDPRNLSDKDLRKVRGKEVGFIFQDPMTRLNPLLTVENHIIDLFKAHEPRSTSISLKKRTKELIELVEIPSNRFLSYPHELSGGMRQRLGIALAIALNPQLVIADEPTTSLDVHIAHKIVAELSKLCKKINSSLLLISHDLAMAGFYCERMAILNNGEIVEEGPSERILKNPESFIGKKLVQAARNKQSCSTPKTPKTKIILEVDCLRSWHPLRGLPWEQAKWIKAVNDVSFRLKAGEALGIVGMSGCGKSTLCRALMGLTRIRGGQVKLDGKTFSLLRGNELRKARQYLQMVFQDPLACFNPLMTIGEAIADPLLIHKFAKNMADGKKQALELIKEVGLNPAEIFQNKLPKELSGGQLQRVAIARAISLQPKVLLCDESVSMLDPDTQTEILALLKNLQVKFGLAIIFITHDISLATGFCHNIIVLNKGNIVDKGPGDKVLANPESSVTGTLIEACLKLPEN